MINWPVTSALLAITINFFIISAVFFFAYSAFSPDPRYEEEDAQPEADLDTVTEEQQRALTRRRTPRDGPGTEDVPSSTRLPSTGRLKPKTLFSSRNLAPSRSNGGMTRCASFPSSRWDWCILQGAPSSAVLQAPCSLHRNGPRYHSNDDLACRPGCSCPGVVVGGDGEHGGQPAHFQNLRSFTDSRVDTEPYYILSFPEGRPVRSSRRSYADGHVSDGDDGYTAARYGTGKDRYPVARHGSSGLRSRYVWKKVPEHDEFSSGSSTECVHTRGNRQHRRVRPYPFDNSFDSDNGCDHHAYGRDFDYGCHHECMDCSDLSLNGHLHSRVPDGAASSSEYLHNWAPGAMNTQDSGLISSEQSASRPLSDADCGDPSNKRSVNKTRARFGLSFKRILSKKDDKSS